MPQNKNPESGNVFLIILIGVVLFGALIFTFSKSGSQGVGTISKQEAKISAQEILNYARLVERAVDRVRRQGCSESEISFQNATLGGYTNTAAPSNNSCHIFNDNGGKISVVAYNPKIHAGSNSSWIEIIGDNAVPNIGSANSDLLLLQEVSTPICTTINSLLNLTIATTPETIEGKTNFTGTFSNDHIIGDQNSSVSSHDAFCVSMSSGRALFVKTLLAR